MAFTKTLISLVILVSVCGSMNSKLYYGSKPKNLGFGMCTACQNVMSEALIDTLEEVGVDAFIEEFRDTCYETCEELNFILYYACRQTCYSMSNQASKFLEGTVEVDSVEEFCYLVHACARPESPAHFDSIEISPTEGVRGTVFDFKSYFTIKDSIDNWEMIFFIERGDEVYLSDILEFGQLDLGSYYVENTFNSYYRAFQTRITPGEYTFYTFACLGKYCADQDKPLILFSGTSTFTITGESDS